MLLSPVGGNERRSIGDARADTVVFIWGGKTKQNGSCLER